MGRLADLLVQQIKEIEVEKIETWNEQEDLTTKVVEKQKVYFWIRLFLKEECDDIQAGDSINLYYSPTNEKLETTFICFDKKGLQKNHEDEIVNFNPEDDKKILCLMIDEEIVNNSDEIPFIRTLFKNSRFFEYQVVKRSELLFNNKRTGKNLDYFDYDL